jgi:hypothetical protein
LEEGDLAETDQEDTEVVPTQEMHLVDLGRKRHRKLINDTTCKTPQIINKMLRVTSQWTLQ